MIRMIFASLFVGLYLLLSIPLLLVCAVIRRKAPKTAERAMHAVVRVVCRGVLFIAGTRVTSIGGERVPEDGAVLFVANHLSIFDTLIPLAYLRIPFGYIAKNNLEHVPLLSQNMRAIRCLFLDREDLRQGLAVIKEAIELIKDGTSVFIYPEGTRNRSGDETKLLPFHRGSFKIAQRTGCRIVPVAFNNADEVLERHFPKIHRAHVVVEYGEPVFYGDLTREEQKHIDEYFRDRITEMVVRNREIV